MIGAEHRAEAERLITAARGVHGDHYSTHLPPALLLAEAQVHATIALASATAEAAGLTEPPPAARSDADKLAEVVAILIPLVERRTSSSETGGIVEGEASDINRAVMLARALRRRRVTL